MEKLKRSLAAKLIAAVLIVCAIAAIFASALSIALLEHYGAYSGGYDTARTAVLNAVCEDRSYEATYNFSNYTITPDEFYPDSAFRFTVTDSEGNIIYDNLGDETVISSYETIDFKSNQVFFAGSAHSTYVNTEKDGKPQPSVKPEKEDEEAAAEEDSYARKSYTLKGYIIEDIPETDDAALLVKLFDTAYSLRYAFFAIAIFSFLASVAFFIFLMSAAGHKRGNDEVKGSFIE